MRKLFRTLREKPWLTQGDELGVPNDEVGVAELADQRLVSFSSLPREQIALRFFIAVVGVIFFLIFITLLERSQYPDFQALAGLPWAPFTNPWQLWVNTSILFASGIALYLSLSSIRKERAEFASSAFVIAGFLALLFLIAQLNLWQQLTANGYGVTINPANSFFYLLTGIHGVHLLGGLIVMGSVGYRYSRKQSLEQFGRHTRLLVSYWNFLFLIWLLVFALLASSQETFETIALLCGFAS